MTPSFLSAFTKLLGNEGGYVDNPADPGGATRWGITQRVAQSWGYDGDMRTLPQETAQAIAYNKYWQPYQLDALPPDVAFQVFDGVFNGGPAVRWLQQAVGVTQDDVMGPATIAAVAAAPPAAVIGRYNAARLLYYTDLQIWPDFGKGWARRVANNLLLMAA
ncbi:MAG TPA: glycosyl hydrolase 108 family protein [Acidocella sp.]|nr:glycosyl hydrolase 108 family protein [Acidocella sp.]